MASVTVRRIRADEALQLREIRLAALADAPYAFTTKHEDMIDKPVAFWAERVETNAADYVAWGVTVSYLDMQDLFTLKVHPDDHTRYELDGEWVGMVAGIHPEPDDPELELVAMWVAPQGRGTGAGAALVNAVVDWGAEIGAPSVGLWVVHGNDHAIALYERCGFSHTPDFVARPSDPCSGELRMTRVL